MIREHQSLEQVDSFKHLENIITLNGSCNENISSRIELRKVEFITLQKRIGYSSK